MFKIFSLLFLSSLVLGKELLYTSELYTSEAIQDQITDLPGLNYELNFNQFSGYLNLNNSKNIHYWLVESEVNSETAPIVFWTNGGPGCSGLIGFMTEQGPFRPDSNKNIQPNQWAWNKFANIVFLEQPVGVGFSYSDNKVDYRIGDDQAAKDNLYTILAFLTRFPKFANSELYITSESYGGHYMPELALEIINYNKNTNTNTKINFMGVAVGNPYVDFYSGTGAQMETYNNFNLLPKPLWDEYVKEGCTDPIKLLSDSICSTYILAFNKMVGNLNPYSLEYPVCITSQQRVFSNFIGDTNEYEPCEDNYASEYLNQESVKKAIHVKTDINWEECSTTTKYELRDRFKSTVKYYKDIIDNDVKLLVYSGDVDGVCGTTYTQKWVFDLGYNYDSLWKIWSIDGQTSGYITQFKTRKSMFTFATVHDAGHEVPTYKPKEAFYLFNAFLNGNYDTL